MARSAAILIHNEKVALIERQRAGKKYYLFPGGTVENGETLEEACIREIREELGLNISVVKLIAEVIYNENHQYYYMCDIISGIFGTGNGEEYSGNLPPEQGTYKPIWMNIDEIKDNPVQPKCVCELIEKSFNHQFKTLKFRDLGNGICVLIDNFK